MENKTIFVTHNSVFHADEVMATAILQYVFGKGKIVRTNNPYEYKDNPEAIIYDIGYGEFDHHQKGGNGKRDNGIPYAACGLIWDKYGIRCIESIIKSMHLCLSESDTLDVWKMINESIIQGIDANDNGYRPDPIPSVKYLSISAIISSLNNIPYYGGVEDPEQDLLFDDAVDICSKILSANIRRFADMKNTETVLKALIKDRDNKHILVLKKYTPWVRAVTENTDKDEIWYVVFPSSRNKGEWNMQAVPLSIDTFEQRHSVPKSWWGGNKETLPKITGVKTASFCHPSTGFLTAAGSLEDILKLAEIACKEDDD